MSVHGQISNKFQVNQSTRLLITESRADTVRFFWRYHKNYNKNCSCTENKNTSVRTPLQLN